MCSQSLHICWPEPRKIPVFFCIASFLDCLWKGVVFDAKTYLEQRARLAWVTILDPRRNKRTRIIKTSSQKIWAMLLLAGLRHKTVFWSVIYAAQVISGANERFVFVRLFLWPPWSWSFLRIKGGCWQSQRSVFSDCGRNGGKVGETRCLWVWYTDVDVPGTRKSGVSYSDKAWGCLVKPVVFFSFTGRYTEGCQWGERPWGSVIPALLYMINSLKLDFVCSFLTCRSFLHFWGRKSFGVLFARKPL